MELYIEYLVEWLQKQVLLANAKGLIVGVSGGIDSAVVAALIKKAFPNDSYGIIMPCYSSESDALDALAVTRKFNLDHTVIDLSTTFDTLENAIKNNITHENNKAYQLALGNAKARLRMTTIYSIAQIKGYLVVGTDNADEWHTGYFTKFGDGGIDIAPLIHLIKSEVVEMAKILGVPSEVIHKAPTAGLFGTQTDEQELGVTYEELDNYLLGKEISIKSKERIEKLHAQSEHKRKIAAHPKAYERNHHV